MKKLLLGIGGLSLLATLSCGDGNIFEPEDPAVQAAIDSALIVNYLADLGYEGDQVGITASGVRFVVLDSGEVVGDPISTTIEDGDIVTFNYTGKTLLDTIFDTSIRKVADSIRMAVESTLDGDTSNIQSALLSSFSEDSDYNPFQFTYSRGSWTTGQNIIGFSLISGFREGFGSSLYKVRVGGKTLIVIPSGQAYGASGAGVLIGSNEVIAFELYPIELTKQ